MKKSLTILSHANRVTDATEKEGSVTRSLKMQKLESKGLSFNFLIHKIQFQIEPSSQVGSEE